MIKRTAQEWADFTGCEICVDEKDIYTLHYEENISIWKENISDFSELKLNQIIKPSEPHVLIPSRLLEEASEIIQRMNTALDGKIKEQEEACPHCGTKPLIREPSSNYSNTVPVFTVCSSCKYRL